MRIQRPRMRRELTALKDWEPPETSATARVRPCVGRTEPTERGIQSIWFLKTAVWITVITVLVANIYISECKAGWKAHQSSMLLRRYPDLSITPSAQISEFLDFGMGMLDVVFDR